MKMCDCSFFKLINLLYIKNNIKGHDGDRVKKPVVWERDAKNK